MGEIARLLAPPPNAAADRERQAERNRADQQIGKQRELQQNAEADQNRQFGVTGRTPRGLLLLSSTGRRDKVG